MSLKPQTTKINRGPQHFKDILSQKSTTRPPAYPWQELALQIIEQLNIPSKKRNSVFKVCKQNPRDYIVKCLNETKELAKTGEPWRYFFKLVNKKTGS
ncbi:MAG: hypothetical protein A3D39_03760 [Candidatus Buchananbacteria bacterium RIFCSPHIGHO2_02_FULL_39_17]|nr:MAG: hypothetical protein A3D39_03760 [Candidatus Buchananbacteria bacterium RIFCSPHIGHO2_02_FULL_39_17]